MKKYLLLACVAIAMLAVGCSKEIHEEEEIVRPQRLSDHYKYRTEQVVNEFKLRMSDMTDVVLFGAEERNGYIIACGMKDGAPLVAKFNKDGSEVFVSVLKDDVLPKRYGFSAIRQLIVAEYKDAMFVQGYFSRDSLLYHNFDRIDYWNAMYYLAALDPNTGKNFKKITESDRYRNIRISEAPDGYLLGISRGYSSEHSDLVKLDKALNRKWSRWYTEYEENSYGDELLGYNGHVMLSGDKLLFYTRVGYLDKTDLGYGAYNAWDEDDYCKIIDLKKPTLIKGFNKKNAPLFSEDDENKLGDEYRHVRIQSATIQGNVIQLNYVKCIEKAVKDPVSGSIKRTPVVIEKCYYKFSATDYSVIEHKVTPVQ